MTNIPPFDRRSSQRDPLGFDEFIGILVAFATIGAVLWWSFGHRNGDSNQWGLLNPNSTGAADSGGLLLPLPTPSVHPNSTQVIPPDEQATPDREESEPETPSTSTEITPGVSLPPLSYLPRRAPNPPQVQPNLPPPDVTAQNGVVNPAEKMPTIPPPIAFTDVPSDFWGRNFINALSSRGIVGGFPEDNTFRPNQPVTRAEYAVIVEKAFNQQQNRSEIAFNDLPANFWATPSVNKAIGAGFLKGYPDKNFKPDQKIPRVQVLVSLVSGLNLKIPSSPEQDISVYQDAKDIPKYAIDKVAAATENGIVVNYPDPKLLEPNKEVTRAEVAAMIHQALVKMGRLQPIPSENIVKPR